MPTECSPDPMLFARLDGRAVVADFGGGAMTSNAGTLLQDATDKAIALVDRFAARFSDGRASARVVHEIDSLVGQRVFGIALGYEDLIDQVPEPVERLFQDRGLPSAIGSDNGLPFASRNGLYNLSKLSVWWLRLGITIGRIKRGQLHENGRHERMHLTLKQEAARPPAENTIAQQERFEDFTAEFSTECPHEALAMQCPDARYRPSSRP